MKPNVGALMRHKKTGGLYRVVANARIEADLTDVVVYASLDSNDTWVRPVSEFMDGRFEEYQA